MNINNILAGFYLLMFSVSAAYGQNMFSAQPLESEADIYYMRARYYDPEVGVFISKDPVGIEAGINSYQYVGGNPVNFTDPLGLYTWSQIASNTIGLIGGGISTVGGLGIATTTGISGVGAVAGVYVAVQGASTTISSGANLIYMLRHPGGSELPVNNSGLAGVATSLAVGSSSNDPNTFAGKANNIATVIDVGTNLAASGAAISAFTTTVSNATKAGTVAGNILSFNRDTQVVSSGLNSSLADYLTGVGAILTTVDSLSSLGSQAQGTPNSSPIAAFGNYNSLDVGGVLIDKAATLVGSNLNDIKGATFDPVSKQIVFLGSGTASATTALNMDYFYTAVQAVYGSAVPPFVTLDPPASDVSGWTDYGNSNGVFEKGETNGMILHYNPIWANEDNTIEVRIRGSWSGTKYTRSLILDAYQMSSPVSGGRYAMGLKTSSSDQQTSEFTFIPDNLNGGSNPPSIYLTPSSQDTYYSILFKNNSTHSVIVDSVTVIPGRQHRKYGGRVDGTKLGWVMYEADRVMKCLAVGKDNLTGASYTSGNMNISGYQNLLERCQAAGSSGGNSRMWFVPNEMTLQRYVDPATGQATIAFDKSTVALLTESYMQGLPQDPNAQAFASHFQQNYDAFAAKSFPVMDPNDSTGQTIINVPIFAMLKEAMQAVSLARFFRDNNIPLDMWWLNSWQPPKAYSPKSVATAYNQSGDQSYVIFGGVQIQKPNSYIPSDTAKNIGQAVIAARPADSAKPAEDIKQQAWSASTSLGSTKAVAASMATDSQIGNVNLAEIDLSFASPGELPLTFTRFYQSTWLGASNLGPGWRNTRYVLQFSSPTWYDENHTMKNGSHAVATDSKGNTLVRSGTIQMIDLLTGAVLDFKSSLVLNYSIDSLGNPYVSVSGLTTGDVPTFTPGKYQSGATMFQNSSYCDYYITMADGSYLVFDYNGYLLQTVDRHGWSQWYDYDSNTGLLSDISDSAGQVISLAYNPTTSMLQSVSGPKTTGTNNQSVTYDYDAKWRLKSVTHDRSQALTAQYTYNDSNQLQDVTRMDGLKQVTTTPDIKGRSGVRRNARGNTNTLAFYKNTTDRSQVAIATDANSTLAPTEKGTDSTGRATYVKDALNNYTLFGYDDVNSILPNTVQLPLSNDGPQRPPVTIKRNTAGLPKTVINPTVSGSTQIEYTSSNFLRRITDTVGRKMEIDPTYTNNIYKVRQFLNGQALETTCGYDNNDYLKTVTDPLSQTWTYARDTMGRLTSATDPSGVKVSCDYDSMGRLWHIYDPKLSSPVTYVYDELDRIKTITTPMGTTSYTYDPVTKRLQSTTENTADGKTRAVVYGYDNNTGDVTSTTYKYQTATGGTASVATSYGYTDYGALNSVTPPGAQPITFTVNEVGQLLATSETDAGMPNGPLGLFANHATSGAWTNVNNQVFAWGAPASSVPVTGYNYAMDASTALVENTTTPTATWNNVSDGQHTFRVRGHNSADKWSPESVFDLWVDTIAPVITDVSCTPSPIPQSTGDAVVSANISDALSGIGTNAPQLRWCISSNATRNWNSYTSMSQGTGSQWTSSISTSWSQHAGKTLYYQIQVQDAAGNVTTITNSASINGSTGVPPMPLWMQIALAALIYATCTRFLQRKPIYPVPSAS